MSERDELETLRKRKELKELRARKAQQPAVVLPPNFESNVALQNLREGDASPVINQMTGTLEAVDAIGGEALGMVAGGLSGIAAISPLGLATGVTDKLTPSNVVDDVRGVFSKPPETPQGKQTVETLGDLAQSGIDLMNIPIAKTAEFIELMTGRTPEEAAAVAESIKEVGFPETFANSVYDKTGSPMLATLAYTAPNAVVEILGALTGNRLAKTSPLKEKLAEQMREPADVPTTEGLAPPERDLSVPGPSDRNVAELMLDGAGNVIKDTYAIDAINQGVDAGVVSAVTASNDVTIGKLREMTHILRRGRENSLFLMDNRPGDVAGRSVLDAIKHIKKVNTDAGKEIGRIAKEELKGQPIDVSGASKDFATAVEDFGIELARDKNGKLKRNKKGQPIVDFTNSNLAPGDRSSMKEVLRQIIRIQEQGPLDAARAHELKRIIDRNVTYGKSQKGLSADPAAALKEFRNGIDTALDNTYPNYNIANTDYAETIQALDEVQRLAGTKIDLFAPGADGAIYGMLRSYLNNTKGRVNVTKSVSDLYRIANKHGAGLTDDIKMQVLYADELDTVFPPVARGSFQGLIGKEIDRGVSSDRTILGTAEQVGKAALNKLRKDEAEKALAALEKLTGVKK